MPFALFHKYHKCMSVKGLLVPLTCNSMSGKTQFNFKHNASKQISCFAMHDFSDIFWTQWTVGMLTLNMVIWYATHKGHTCSMANQVEQHPSAPGWSLWWTYWPSTVWYPRATWPRTGRNTNWIFTYKDVVYPMTGSILGTNLVWLSRDNSAHLVGWIVDSWRSVWQSQ